MSLWSICLARGPANISNSFTVLGSATISLGTNHAAVFLRNSFLEPLGQETIDRKERDHDVGMLWSNNLVGLETDIANAVDLGNGAVGPEILRGGYDHAVKRGEAFVDVSRKRECISNGHAAQGRKGAHGPVARRPLLRVEQFATDEARLDASHLRFLCGCLVRAQLQGMFRGQAIST